MDTTPQKASLPSVIAAGVVAILLALFGALSCALTGFALLLLPELQRINPASAMLPQIRMMTAVFMLMMLAVSIFGIFVGIGVIRRRNWARISILIWGGLMTFFCLMFVAFSLVTFSSMSSMQLPNMNSAQASGMMHFMSIFMAVFYGIPAVIGIWWLILFTRPRVVAAFTNPVSYAPEIDASGFPHLANGQPAPAQNKSTCPIPLAIVAGFMIFGGVCSLAFLFFPFPSGIPLFFFGHAFAGASVKIYMVAFGLLSGIAGVGVLKLKPWALYAAIGIQLLSLLNCATTFLAPAYMPTMRAAIEKMSSQNPAFATGSPLMSDSYFRAIMVVTSLFVALLLAILLWQRSHFLEAASAAKT